MPFSLAFPGFHHVSNDYVIIHGLVKKPKHLDIYFETLGWLQFFVYEFEENRLRLLKFQRFLAIK